MKMYNNGQRPTKMYGGGMASPRKPMQMGGLAQQNRKMTTGMAGMENPMGRMTEKKRYDMGMNLGGKANKKLAAMYGNPNKITRGDIITAAKKKQS
mgnify:CR=1 FL=1